MNVLRKSESKGFTAEKSRKPKGPSAIINGSHGSRDLKWGK